MSQVRIVGIDVAVSDKGTALCEGFIEDGVLHVETIKTGCDDPHILARMRTADRCGIDAPFGWPVAFVESLTKFEKTGRWLRQPVDHEHTSQRLRPELRLRATDLAVQTHTRRPKGSSVANPLSVSTDKIAGCAMRTAYLLTEFANEAPTWTFDRTGMEDNVQRLLEVYPGASLACWGVDRSGYKGTKPGHRDGRERILETLKTELPTGTLDVSGVSTADLLSSDHALDAFISFLTAAVVSPQGGSIPPDDDVSPEHIAAEGWIHLPAKRLADISFAA